MALSGSVTTTSCKKRSLTLTWSATQNVSNNTSSISWRLKGSGSYNGYVSIYGVKITINGVIVHDHNYNALHCYKNTDVASSNSPVTIQHNADGSKSFTIKVEAGIYYNTLNCTGKSTFTLNAIQRGAVITSVENITLGNNCNISWTPSANTHYYRLKFSLGNWSHTTGLIHPNQTTSYQYAGYTVPVSDVSSQITNSETEYMTVYLYTYSDSNGKNQIGAASSKSFKVTIPSSVKPTLSSVGIAIDNSANAVIQGWDVAVVGYTKLRVTGSASGIYNSTINSFTLSDAYSKTVSGSSLDYTGSAMTFKGQKSVTVKAIDSRGRASNSLTTNSILFYPYSAPKISSFSVSRVSGDGNNENDAGSVKVKATWFFSKVNDHNTSTATLYYKKASESAWTMYSGSFQGTRVADQDESLSTVQYKISTNVKQNAVNGESPSFTELYSYDFKIVITDALGSKAQSSTLIPSMKVLLDFKEGGGGMGIGRVAETNKLEIALDTVFFGSVSIKSGESVISLEQYIRNIINGS